MPVVGANLEGQERLLEGQVGADYQHGFLLVQVRGGGQLAGFSTQSVQQARNIAAAMVIDIARPEHLSRELLQVEILLVGGVVGADHAKRAVARARVCVELRRDALSASLQETSSSLPFLRTIGDCRRSG